MPLFGSCRAQTEKVILAADSKDSANLFKVSKKCFEQH